MKNLPARIWIPVVVVVGLVIVGLVVFLAWPKIQPVSRITGSGATLKEIPADWKTYRDEGNRFDIKYPTEWGEPELGPLADPTVLYLGASSAPSMDEAVILQAKETSGELRVTPPHGLVQEWNRSEATINGRKTVRFEKEHTVAFVRGAEGPFVYREISVWIDCTGKAYNLSLRRESEDTEAFEVYQQIVSSFRCHD